MTSSDCGVVTHATTVLDWMESCRRSEQFLDTLIQGADGVTRCHRLVLTSVSPLLQDILRDDEEDACIIIPDMSNAELEMLTQFIYTGCACVESDNVVRVLNTLLVPVDKVSSNSCHNHLQSKTTTMILPRTETRAQIFAIDNADAENLVQEHEKSEEIVKNELELYSCNICDLHFDTETIFKHHMASHLSDYNCSICQKSFKVKSDYDKHIEIDHPTESEVKSLDSPPVPLKQPLSLSKTSRSFHCSLCPEIFRWRAEYRRHAELVHGQKITDPMVPCNICNKQIVAKRLNEHIKTVHGNERPYKCEYQQCDKKFAKPSELRNHLRTHTGERPYKCDVCNASFTYSHILTRHKKYHEGTKKFTCKFCDKSFLQRNDLVKHSRIHSGEKPYSCNICGKDFARMDYLKKHQVLHSNDTKFCCGECGELCASVDGLKKHKAHHHKPACNLELNSFDDLALQLPGLEMESIHESIQAVSIDGGKTIMILNDVTDGVHVDMEGLDTNHDTILSSGSGELVLAQSDLEADANVLYAVQY